MTDGEEILKEGWAIKACMDGEVVIRGGMFDGMVIRTNSWMRPDTIGVEQADGSIKTYDLAEMRRQDAIGGRFKP